MESPKNYEMVVLLSCSCIIQSPILRALSVSTEFQYGCHKHAIKHIYCTYHVGSTGTGPMPDRCCLEKGRPLGSTKCLGRVGEVELAQKAPLLHCILSSVSGFAAQHRSKCGSQVCVGKIAVKTPL